MSDSLQPFAVVYSNTVSLYLSSQEASLHTPTEFNITDFFLTSSVKLQYLSADIKFEQTLTLTVMFDPGFQCQKIMKNVHSGFSGQVTVTSMSVQTHMY